MIFSKNWKTQKFPKNTQKLKIKEFKQTCKNDSNEEKRFSKTMIVRIKYYNTNPGWFRDCPFVFGYRLICTRHQPPKLAHHQTSPTQHPSHPIFESKVSTLWMSHIFCIYLSWSAFNFMFYGMYGSVSMRQCHSHIKIQNLTMFGYLATVLANVHKWLIGYRWWADRRMDISIMYRYPLHYNRHLIKNWMYWMVNWIQEK